MPYKEENKGITILERTEDKYYIDRLPLVVLEEDIWSETMSYSTFSEKEESPVPYVKDNTLYIKGLLTPASISIYNLNGNNLK